MSRFQVEEIAKRKRERQERKEIAIERAKEFMIKNPTASRSRVATYAGVAVVILESWGVVLPKPLTAESKRMKTSWAKGHML
tara:strand:- start:607 stop:852 length:246 start_codon:yes stop_codon:yes gene_type:complete